MTGGAAIAACSGGSVRGRCRSHTLSCASMAKLDGSPSFHFSGTFGQAGSTSKVGRLLTCELWATSAEPGNHSVPATAMSARAQITMRVVSILMANSWQRTRNASMAKFQLPTPNHPVLWELDVDGCELTGSLSRTSAGAYSRRRFVPRYSFADIVVDAESRRVTRAGELLSIPERHLGVLLELLGRKDSIVSKDALIEAVWQDVAVTDNSLEQAVSALRRALGTGPDGQPYIQTVPRQGYRFVGTVTKTAERASDDDLEALLAPHRAWVEGRAALETLERDQIVRARHVFEGVLERAADHASAHIGLANACIMQFEMTRADEKPDVASSRSGDTAFTRGLPPGSRVR